MGQMEQKTSQVCTKQFQNGVLITHVFDNIEWKNKTFKCRETHNTNPIYYKRKMKLNTQIKVMLLLISDIVSIENFVNPTKG